jgi:predicted RNA-binding Zn ribbon-like protein
VEESAQPDASWRLVGERICLDFVNTVGGRVSSPDGAGVTRDYADQILRDNIPGYDALLRWSVFASLLEPSEADRLRDQARQSPDAAKRVWRRALRLREALYRIGKALIEDWPPPGDDLRILDQEVREARQHQRLVAGQGRLEAEWIADPPRLDRMLWPIALSAAAVFSSDDVNRLKQCGGPRCGWLFVDATRNHSRQWCEMANCGNLAKVHRFRERRRRGRAG